MNLLLDSHVLLWYDQGDRRFPKDIVDILDDRRNRVLVSVVTIWEFAIKRSIGKLPSAATGSIRQMVLRHGFEILNLTADHAEGVLALPRHHRDPFDHMLIAQALHEKLTLVTHDQTLARYNVPLLIL